MNAEQKEQIKQANKQYEDAHRDCTKAGKKHSVAKSPSAEAAAKKEYDAAYARMKEAGAVITRINEEIYRAKYPPVPPASIVCGGLLKVEAVNWKRFSLDGLTIEAPCPTCQNKIESLCGDYLSYPAFGEPVACRLWCETCAASDSDSEYEGHEAVLQINVTLSAPTEAPKRKE